MWKYPKNEMGHRLPEKMCRNCWWHTATTCTQDFFGDFSVIDWFFWND